MNYKLIIPIILVIFIFGCENPGTNDTEIIQSSTSQGRLALTPLEGMGKLTNSPSLSKATDGDTVSFDLGPIKASKNFYFILKNTGGTAITDININSDSPDFTMSPAQIGTLEPDSISSIVPILSIGALHGTALDGVGFTDIMEAGINSTLISITGTTSNDTSDSIPVGFTANMSVEAQVVDARVFTQDGEINYTNPAWIDEGIFNGVNVPLPQYFCADSFSVINISNVPIIVSEWEGLSYQASYLREHSLEIGDTLKGRMETDLGSDYYQHFLQFSAQGTVVNPERLRMSTNGASHIWLTNQRF